MTETPQPSHRGGSKVIYHTLGCKLNFAETSSLGELLRRKGYERAVEGEVPDVVVVNTCSVTTEADKKCRQIIRSFHQRYPRARILVTGCYAQLCPGDIAAIEGVALVAGSNDKIELARQIERWSAEDEPCATLVTPLTEIKEFVASCSRGDRTRYFLKVQDGCDYWCSYCTIPRARGRSRSGSIASLVEQARKVADEGGREIVLTGVNVGDFGKGTSETFLDLIRALDGIDGIDRFRISSIEPNLLTDEIIEFVASSRRFMPHFHLPLQCGDDRVLELMRRHYDSALFRHRVDTIRRLIPDAFIGVDLITGARGETDERFANSRQFVEGLDISRLHVFPYSERPGTRALTLEGEVVVDQAEKHRRAKTMIEISERKLADFSRRFIGTVRPALMEQRSRGGLMKGFTDNYLRVAVTADASIINRIADVRITGPLEGGEPGELRGEVVCR